MSVPQDFYALFDQRPAQQVVNGGAANVTPINGDGHAYALAALQGEALVVSNAREGTRNHTLNVAAFRMGRHVGAGTIDRQLVRDALADAARIAGLPEAEIDTVLRDADNAGINQGALNPRHPSELETPAVTVLDLDADTEADFWHARPVLTHLHTFSRARLVSPWAVLGATLARVIVATPNQVCIPPIVGGTASLNSFIGLVGRSGSGKGAAERVAADAVLVGDIKTVRLASGEAITHVYKHRVKGSPEPEWRDDEHAALIEVAEIDRLAGQAGRQGATIMAELRSAWSGETLGQVAADSTRSIPLEAHQYRLCLIAGIQPSRAGCLLDEADGGTPQRFLWMPATDPDAPDVEPEEPSPITWKAPPAGRFATIGGIKVDVCDTAVTTIKDARRANRRGDVDALDGHALLTRLKTAAAFGVLDGRYSVTDEDWHLAGVVMQKSDATRAEVVKTLSMKTAEANHARAEAEAKRTLHVAETVVDAAIKRVCGVVLRKLRREGDWTGGSDVRKAVRSTDRKHIDEALERLAEAGQIEVQETTGSGGSGARIRAIGGAS